MNRVHRKLESSQCINLASFSTLLAVLAVLALMLLRQKLRTWTAVGPVICKLSPGIAAVVCIVALYYEERSTVLLRFTCSVVFLQALLICVLFLHRPI